MSADELKQLADSGKKFVLLDVREAEEIEQKGTLKNYLHIPLGELDSRITEVPKNVPIVVACNRGVRAGRAAVLLEKKGYEDVKSVGLAEYRDKGYELLYPKVSRRSR
jgi:rhodanese-related sulfurtransferase